MVIADYRGEGLIRHSKVAIGQCPQDVHCLIGLFPQIAIQR